jgi:enoyl-CoA hydratase/carnithine racemase
MNLIECATDGGLLTITFNRPDRKNSITATMYRRLADAIGLARVDREVRTVLIEGSGDVFSAGNDIDEFLNDPPVEPGAPAFEFLRALADFPKPLVAAVRGAAVGVGATMLFHCDLVYAAENSVFSLPFIDLGLCPEAGSALLAPQTLGYHKACEALLLGEPISAASASALGFVNRVLPSEEVSRFARTQATRLAAKPLSGLLETKRLLKGHQQGALKAQMEEEVRSFLLMLEGAAAREAFTAFAQKRKPDFSRL